MFSLVLRGGHAVLLAGVIGLGVAPLAAQEPRPQTRQGFWMGFGFGVGSFGCQGCEHRLTGGSGYFRLGGTVSQTVLLGVETNAWSKDEEGASLVVTQLNSVAYLYPRASSGFHFKVGVGLATIDIDAAPFGGRESGAGLLLGLGYDGRIGRNVSLVPFLNLLAASVDGGSPSNMVQVGLGLSWH